jgi:hypothetical protein
MRLDMETVERLTRGTLTTVANGRFHYASGFNRIHEFFQVLENQSIDNAR